MPLASSLENRMSMFVRLLYFIGGILWMLFTNLCWDFLRDLKDPLVDGPPKIIFISPIALFGRLYKPSPPATSLSRLILLSAHSSLCNPPYNGHGLGHLRWWSPLKFCQLASPGEWILPSVEFCRLSVWRYFLSLLHPLQSSLALSLSLGMLSSPIAAILCVLILLGLQ